MALSDPLNSSDLLLNSFEMGVVNMGTDWYEAAVLKKMPMSDAHFNKVHGIDRLEGKAQADAIAKAKKSGFKEVDKFLENKPALQNELRQLQNAGVNQHATTKPISKWFREKANNPKSKGPLKWLGGLVDSPESAGAQDGTRRFIHKHLGTLRQAEKSATGVLKTELGQVLRANTVRGWGTLAIGLMGANMASGIVQGAVKTMVDKGYASAGAKTSFSSSAFLDSQMAYTTRQRALRAIQTSQSGLRRASGQEANFLHNYR